MYFFLTWLAFDVVIFFFFTNFSHFGKYVMTSYDSFDAHYKIPSFFAVYFFQWIVSALSLTIFSWILYCFTFKILHMFYIVGSLICRIFSWSIVCLILLAGVFQSKHLKFLMRSVRGRDHMAGPGSQRGFRDQFQSFIIHPHWNHQDSCNSCINLMQAWCSCDHLTFAKIVYTHVFPYKWQNKII